MEFDFDVYADSLKKFGELKCGDIVNIAKRGGGGVDIFLADGIGSGFTANLHAGMTSQLVMSMLDRGERIETIVNTVAGNMEKSDTRKIAYCAFTIVSASVGGELSAAVFHMPDPVILRRGKPVPFEKEETKAGSRVKILKTALRQFDTVAIFSDGVTKAGIGGSLNLGFGHNSVVSYLKAAYKPHIPAQKLVNLLLSVCNSLYLEKPGDDVSCAIIRAYKKPL